MTSMVETVRPVLEGYRTLTQSLVVVGADRFLDFLKKAFGAREAAMFRMPDGSVGHAEVLIGDSRIMLGEAGPEWPAMPGRAYMYVSDADAVYRQALAAGAVSVRELRDAFYGDRNGAVKDPFGNVWTIATHKEDLSEEEMRKRMAAQASP